MTSRTWRTLLPSRQGAAELSPDPVPHTHIIGRGAEKSPFRVIFTRSRDSAFPQCVIRGCVSPRALAPEVGAGAGAHADPAWSMNGARGRDQSRGRISPRRNEANPAGPARVLRFSLSPDGRRYAGGPALGLLVAASKTCPVRPSRQLHPSAASFLVGAGPIWRKPKLRRSGSHPALASGQVSR